MCTGGGCHRVRVRVRAGDRESEIDREGEGEGELPWNEKKHECLCQEEVARMLCHGVLWCSRRRLWKRL